jgi:hypothetical protein
MSKKLIIVFGAIIIALLVFFAISNRVVKNHYEKKIAGYEKQLVNLQDQVKVAEGMYSVIVDKYNVTERALRDSIANKDQELSKWIRKNKETIQSYESYILTLKGGKDTVYIRGDTVLGMKAFTLTYPKLPEKPFITYLGVIDSLTIRGEWKFGSLPITGTIVEQKNGTWKYYISAPEWVNVSGIEVKVLPKLDSPKVRKLYFPVGVGYQIYFDGQKSLYLTGGVQYKRWQFLVHSSMFEYGFGGCYLF